MAFKRAVRRTPLAALPAAFAAAGLAGGCGGEDRAQGPAPRVLTEVFLSPGPELDGAVAKVSTTAGELARTWAELGGSASQPAPGSVPNGTVVAVVWAGRANGSAVVRESSWSGGRLKLVVEVPPREGCTFPAVVGGGLSAVAIARAAGDRGPVDPTAVVEERRRSSCDP
jgi:hypothetical protein